MWEARLIVDRLAGPKQLEVFEGLGHVSLLKAKPEQWTRVVGDFLRPFSPALAGVEAGH
jgi:hypothetical protein